MPVSMKTKSRFPAAPAALFASAIALSACGHRIDPIPLEEHRARAAAEAAALFSDQEPVTGELTLAEALARSLKYNYDHRLAQMETTLQNAQLDLTIYQQLPKLTAGAGYIGRTNESASSSLSVITRRQSLEPSTSQDQERFTADLTATWNVLDFGVAVYQTRQQADRALVAAERRRKVVNNLVKEVQSTFWRAATAQQILPRIDAAILDAEKALENSRAIEAQRLGPVIETLEYQKTLLTTVSQLRRLRSEFSVARAQLAALVNIPIGSDYVLATPEVQPLTPSLVNVDMQQLELAALALRPDIREEAYQQRIDRNGVWKEIARMFPNLQFVAGWNFDSNSFLTYQNWGELAIRATYNLINVLQQRSAINAAEAQEDVTRTRRLALSIAVITQVHVGVQQYRQAIDNLKTASELSDIETRLDRAVNESGDSATQSELDRIRRSTSAIAAELDRSRAGVDLRAALANLYTTLGVDLLPVETVGKDLATLTGEVADMMAPLQRGEMPPILGLEPETWRVASETTFPPYNYDEGGKRVGIDTAIVEAISERIGVRLKHETSSFDEVVQKIFTDQVDFGYQFTGSPERLANWNMVGPIRTGRHVLVSLSDSPLMTANLGQLDGRTIGTVTGYRYSAAFDRATNFVKLELPGNAQVVDALLDGSVDAAVGDSATLRYHLRLRGAEDRVKELAPALSEANRFIAFPKARADKAKRFAEGLEKIRADGTLDRILADGGVK